MLLLQLGLWVLLSCPAALCMCVWHLPAHFYVLLRQNCWLRWLEHLSSIQKCWLQHWLKSLERGSKIQPQIAQELRKGHLIASLPQADPAAEPLGMELLHTHQWANVNKRKSVKPCDQGLCLAPILCVAPILRLQILSAIYSLIVNSKNKHTGTQTMCSKKCCVLFACTSSLK